MKTILAINPGSTSYKCALFYQGQPFLSTTQEVSQVTDIATYFETYFTEVKRFLLEKGTALDAIAIRVVAPGKRFQSHQVFDEVLHTLLRDREYTAPLHIPKVLRAVMLARESFRGVPVIALSDSAYHSTLPFIAREYSLPKSERDTYELQRYGYHGISVSSVVDRVHAVLGGGTERILVCHGGGGVSITAVKHGVSIDTTGGFGPLSGIPMASRAGELDPSVVLELLDKRNLKPRDASHYLQQSGGLQGLGGTTDLRILLDRQAHGDLVAEEALAYFSYHFQKAFASLTVALGGVDAVVFTGTAFVRSSALRQQLTAQLGVCGIMLDDAKNESTIGKAGMIHPTGATVKVAVIPSEELWKMAIIADTFIPRKEA